MNFSPDTLTIGKCDWCGEPANRFENLDMEDSRDLVLLCDNCREKALAERGLLEDPAQ